MEPRRRSLKVDFFRDLPESLSHKIISLLDIKHVARVSSLSSRCRQICLSSPFLTINLGKISGQEFYRFNAFLHRFMSLRNGFGMHKFEVKMYGHDCDDDVEFHIGNWLLEASRCNVEKICLGFDSFGIFTLPIVVLNSACLSDLELSMISGGLLKFPTASFGALENLTLRGLGVSIEFCVWISSCKSLKMVHLQGVGVLGGINISSSSLEDLTLHNVTPDNFKIKVSAERLKNLRIVLEDDGEYSQSLTLHAPKLERFILAGSVCNYSCEGNLEFLCYSDISTECNSIFKDEYGSLDNGIIGKVLQSVQRVSSMCVHDFSIKEISSPELLPEFSNLLSLTLKRMSAHDEITSIISLLKLMPHLNTLKIQGFPYCEEEKSYSAEYWESHNLAFVDSLEEVEMEILGENNEIELIKYLLKNARALKKMTILYESELCGKSRKSAVSRKIRELQIASSCVALYVLPM